MNIPDGLNVKSKHTVVCKLNKSLYGLKQASRCWNATFTKFLKEFEFKPCEADICRYIQRQEYIFGSLCG